MKCEIKRQYSLRIYKVKLRFGYMNSVKCNQKPNILLA